MLLIVDCLSQYTNLEREGKFIYSRCTFVFKMTLEYFQF